VRPDDLIQLTEQGLHCPAGGFHVDPWRPVRRAVVTHAHADHARSGSRRYLATPETAVILRRRIGRTTSIETLAYGERRRIGDVHVSLHPAGHVLGSAQVRIEPVRPGPTWVITGDYALGPNPTCAPFEPVRCDVLLTESTFGLPVFRWREPDTLLADINTFWHAAQDEGKTTVLLGWSLGKAQRMLAGLDPAIGPIGTHAAVEEMCACYRRCGVALPDIIPCGDANTKASGAVESIRGRGVVVAPPAVYGSKWLRNLASAEGLRVANVSGWMALRGPRRWRPVDRGFPLSDHADWPALLHAIRLSGASRVGVTHGFARTLSRWLTEQGLDAFVVPTRFTGEQGADDSAPLEPGASDLSSSDGVETDLHPHARDEPGESRHGSPPGAARNCETDGDLE